ncbi:MAG: FixH family protein [Bacteroidales bacterium]|nr:FixH family protein [Bacteroidales bacterium]
MKWNWGTKLLLAMAAFMIMVIVFVVLMMRESVDLVDKDYYPKGQSHQDQINKRNNAADLADQIQVNIVADEVVIAFPSSMKSDGISGNIHFYQRTSDIYDKQAVLVVDSNNIFKYPASALQGRYIVKIEWAYEGEAFYIEKSISLP